MEKLEVSTEEPDNTIVKEDAPSCVGNESGMSTGLLEVASLDDEKKATKAVVEDYMEVEKMCSSESNVTTEENSLSKEETTSNYKTEGNCQNKSEETYENISEEKQKRTLADSSEFKNKDRIDETSKLTFEDIKPQVECAETSKLDTLDAELDDVVAEATKLQSEVLKSIIGSKTKYIPKTIDSIEDEQVSKLDENANDASKETINMPEGGSKIFKTETIHIEMNIKDKIEEITIENEKSEEVEEVKEYISGEIEKNFSETLETYSSENEKDYKSKNKDDKLNVNSIAMDSNQNEVNSLNDGCKSVDEPGENSFEKKDEIIEEENVIMVKSETTEDDKSIEEQKVADVNENKSDITNRIENSEIADTTLERSYSIEEKVESNGDGLETDTVETNKMSDETLQRSVKESLQEEEDSMKSDTIEPSLSQTPDLVKVCEKEIDSSDENILKVIIDHQISIQKIMDLCTAYWLL